MFRAENSSRNISSLSIAPKKFVHKTFARSAHKFIFLRKKYVAFKKFHRGKLERILLRSFRCVESYFVPDLEIKLFLCKIFSILMRLNHFKLSFTRKLTHGGAPIFCTHTPNFVLYFQHKTFLRLTIIFCAINSIYICLKLKT